MALGKKAYPKATLKKIIKAHSNHTIKKNADVTVRSNKASDAFRWVLTKQTDLSRLRLIHGDVRHFCVIFFSRMFLSNRMQTYQRGGSSVETIGRKRFDCEECQKGHSSKLRL
jgi:hypothetical protein